MKPEDKRHEMFCGEIVVGGVLYKKEKLQVQGWTGKIILKSKAKKKKNTRQIEERVASIICSYQNMPHCDIIKKLVERLLRITP